MICQGFGRHAGARVAGQKATGVRRVKGGISRAMRAIRRVLVVVLGGLLILAAILLGGGYLWMRGSLPKTAGEVRISALEAPATVRRTSDGMVRIHAANEHDHSRPLVIVHVKSRRWQQVLPRPPPYTPPLAGT